MHLNNVVKVDKENMTVHCEPMVTMGQMTMTLEDLGVTIPVLPELDDLTVGGLICGVGVETSSHRHGLFTHSCIEYELVTAEGELKRCSATENEELFRAIPWSHGTLGFLVGVTMKIVESKPWIKLDYEPYHDKAEVRLCACVCVRVRACVAVWIVLLRVFAGVLAHTCSDVIKLYCSDVVLSLLSSFFVLPFEGHCCLFRSVVL